MSPGDKFDVPYPFLRCKAEVFDTGEPREIDSWRPGVEYVPSGPYGEDSEAQAHAVGAILLEVVSTHRPGKKYPERVFYVRQWRDPDGRVFGKTQLRMTTKAAFMRRTNGWNEPYTLTSPEEAQAAA